MILFLFDLIHFLKTLFSFILLFLVGEPELNITLSVSCVVSPGWMRCSDRSEKKENCTVTISVYMCTHSRGHNIVNIGMSINVAWFPNYGHIVARIFFTGPQWTNMSLQMDLRSTGCLDVEKLEFSDRGCWSGKMLPQTLSDLHKEIETDSAPLLRDRNNFVQESLSHL